ncbi:helix-turn-helix domain-containing protein [Streptomyces sp. O3]
MSRWKGLPDSLDPRARQFVVQLRRLKDHSGLGLAALASKTGYSRSSWDRYLNGKALPPAEAVEALARTCGTDPARLLAEREVAAEAWNAGRAGSGAASADRPDADGPETDGPETDRPEGDRPEGDPLDADQSAAGRSEAGQGTASGPAPAVAADSATGGTATGGTGADAGRSVPWLAMLASSVTTALVMLAVLALWAPWQDDGGSGAGNGADAKPYTGPAHPELGEFTYQPGKTYECDVERDDDGRLYAGYSRTRTELIEQTSTRWSVVEAQCLLEHHEFSPEGTDGAFGNNTERAVRRLQDQANIAVDGKVGPDTWKVLRE